MSKENRMDPTRVKYKIQNPKCKIQNPKYKIQNPKQMINIQFNMTPTLAVGVGLVLCVFSV
jgi:hypothetical protein